jgi:hypothetical protein
MSNSQSPLGSVVGERFPWVSFLGVAGAFLIFVVILCIAYVPKRSYQPDQVRAKERFEILANVRSKAKKEAEAYAWVDQTAGVVRLPISRAMELLVDRKGIPLATTPKP